MSAKENKNKDESTLSIGDEEYNDFVKKVDDFANSLPDGKFDVEKATLMAFQSIIMIKNVNLQNNYDNTFTQHILYQAFNKYLDSIQPLMRLIEASSKPKK